MPNILFINHKIQNCGVYQYGKRLFDILKKDPNINYIYCEVDSLAEYDNCISVPANHYTAIIYNYHCSTMPWLSKSTVQTAITNIGIPHESPNDFFDIVLNIDPTTVSDDSQTRSSLPRPIFENLDDLDSEPFSTPEIRDFITVFCNSGLPIFGSFGFGFDNKGFDKIVTMVNEQYDNAIIKFVIPHAHFGPNSDTIHLLRKKCMQLNTKPGIVLMVTHDFLSTTDILRFLKSNTMNIFLYDQMHGRGISSTIDYALSVKTPIGISDSYMFRNIYSDEICLYKNTIADCMAASVKHCAAFLDAYSHRNMITKFAEILAPIMSAPVNHVVTVSMGEAIDKLSILEIKRDKIKDADKCREIQKEIDALSDYTQYTSAYPFYYQLLIYINTKIWDLTDIVKSISATQSELYAQTAYQIFEHNQKRFRIKNWFNLCTSSNIKEQKSYAANSCIIRVDSKEVLYSKIAEINHLLLAYDNVTFNTPFMSDIRRLFRQLTIVNTDQNSAVISLENYTIQDSDSMERQAYEFPPIIYIAGGMFGDFIHMLSVICEKFHETGRKGILYISEKGHFFRNGLESTYADTYPVIIKQQYIRDYRIYTGVELYDIDLTEWREKDIRTMYNQNFHIRFSHTFGIDWGKHKWLDVGYDPKWKGKTIVNTTQLRFPCNISKLLQLIATNEGSLNNLIFIMSKDNISEYEYFCDRTQTKLEYYEFTDFGDLTTAINSCQCFIGSCSGPLTIAHATHKKRVICFAEYGNDATIYHYKFNEVFDNVDMLY